MAEAARQPKENEPFCGIHPPSDCYSEVRRTLRFYNVTSPNELSASDVHVLFHAALDELEKHSSWCNDEHNFVEILFFLDMAPLVQSQNFVRLALCSFQFLSSKCGRASPMKRALLSMLVHFAQEIQHHRVLLVEAACELAENELKLQIERLARKQVHLFLEDLEGFNLVIWATNSFLSTSFARQGNQAKRRVARLLTIILLHFPNYHDLSRPQMLRRTIKKCLYAAGLANVVPFYLLLAVSQIAAQEVPRTKAKTIVKLFYRRVVNTGNLSVTLAENILFRLCLRLYRFGDDEDLIFYVRKIAHCILVNYPIMIPRFRQSLNQVWTKYRPIHDHEFHEELSMIFQPQW